MTAAPLVRPQLRGVSHQIFFFVAVIAGLLLIRSAPTERATWGAATYAGSLALLLGVSATYHRVWWQPGPRAWMRRLDHASIFVLIAGTYTPLCLTLAEGSGVALTLIWSVAALGALKSVLWPSAPRALVAALYIAMGWGGLYLTPTLLEHTGVAGLAMILVGGLFYSVGAVFYALKRPNPFPGVFGYHEIFHALVVLASMLHFAVIIRVVAAL